MEKDKKSSHGDKKEKKDMIKEIVNYLQPIVLAILIISIHLINLIIIEIEYILKKM